jgi:hypothetical protein
VQTGSIVPCMLFHVTYNLIMLSSPVWSAFAKQQPVLNSLIYEWEPGHVLYHWPIVALCTTGAAALLVWLHRLPYQATREEQISDARARQPHHPLTASAPSSAE